VQLVFRWRRLVTRLEIGIASPQASRFAASQIGLVVM
jgi:hypothetical protein